jgi:D-arginine dehydrogenase
MTAAPRILIIGAGMAGASLAPEIDGAEITLIEAEAQPGYHSTGRSAAFWSETYGGPMIQPLTSASGAFLNSPPPDFHDRSFLHARGALTIARAEGEAELDRMEGEFERSGVTLERLDRPRLVEAIPSLRQAWRHGLLEPGCADIDVAALHLAYLRRARRNGVTLVTGCRVTALSRAGGQWKVVTKQGSFAADIVVDAAGAWADEVATMAGAGAVGIQPYRRTIAQLRIDPAAPSQLPLVIDIAGRFYFKPESGGRLWVSPHDETACGPCDAAAEEIDIALAVDRLQKVVDWRVEHVEHRWAGLRSFAPDRLPVYGYDPRVEGFFWFAGQGGFGIQTAPAAAWIGAALLMGKGLPAAVEQIDASNYAPTRLLRPE